MPQENNNSSIGEAQVAAKPSKTDIVVNGRERCSFETREVNSDRMVEE